MFPLTKLQQAVKTAIVEMTSQQGEAPTIRELATRLKMGTTATHSELKLLRERGHVTWLPGRERSLMVLEDGGAGYALPAHVQAQLDLYCVTNREDCRSVVIDAVVLHLDAVAAKREAAE